MGLGDKSMQHLVNIIQKKADTKNGLEYSHLDLSKNGLKDEGVYLLADMLKTNESILHLDLSGNPIC